jgi:hypothetical protein
MLRNAMTSGMQRPVGILAAWTLLTAACGSQNSTNTSERPVSSAPSPPAPSEAPGTASFDYTDQDGLQYRFTAIRGTNTLTGPDSATGAPPGKHYVTTTLMVRNLLAGQPAKLPVFAALTHLRPGPAQGELPYGDPDYVLMVASIHPDRIPPGGSITERLVSNEPLDESFKESYGLAVYDIAGKNLLGYASYA